jgi:FkbM family methyltransferase
MTPTLEQVNGFWTREGTTDANAVYALADDEYGLLGQTFEGWAIDVGAHIGTVSLMLARTNPDLRVLAIEAVPENSDLLERNIATASLEGRIISVRASAARPGAITGLCHYGYRHREEEGDSYVSAHRFVGNTWVDRGEPEFSVTMPAVSLDDLLDDYGIDDVAVLKIDCEGCEWAFLDTPAVSRVALIVGEFHGGYPGHEDFVQDPMARITEMLSSTHDVEIVKPDPCVGLFRAVRR